jgi:hypothetical protein
MKRFLSIALVFSSLSIIADDIYLNCETEKHSKYSWFKENIEAGNERHSYLVKISKSFKDLGGYQLVDIDLIQIHEEKPGTSSLREEGRFDIWYIDTQKDIIKLEKEKTDKEKQKEFDQLKRNKI